jgi:multicomponent Na+:H+ antiporter subunit G
MIMAGWEIALFWLSKLCIIIGAAFMFVAAVGVFRMPDIYMRLHANTKSATFGAGFLLFGAVIELKDWIVASRSLAILIFLFATAPVAAHMIGRAAHFAKAPRWGLLGDDMEDKYDPKTHELAGMKKPRKPKTTKSKREKTIK